MLEAGAGAALLIFPSACAVMLLGAPLEGSAAVTLGRVTGVALLALGMANWFAQYDGQSRAAKGIIGAMVVYNLGAVVTLGSSGIFSPLVGILLWPGVVVHGVMAVWCVTVLLRKPTPNVN
ncbi:MAG: hypothetical protein ACKVP0_03305 [Pirellulaceae bacterium]